MVYCGKVCFPTQEEADDVLAYIGRQTKVEPVQSVYACSDCGGWHLTPLPNA